MANEFAHKTVGSSMTQAEYEAIGGHVLDSQAIGDIVYATSTSQLSRLGIGATGAVLTVTGGIPAWDTTWTPTGALIPAADDTYDLGSAGAAWQDLFLEGDISFTDAGTISTAGGDLNIGSAVDINIAVTDNTATALTILQGSDAYLIIDTANSSESVSIGTGISGTAITLGHGTSEVTVADNLSVTGDAAVDGTANLDDTDIDGTLVVDGSNISLDSTTTLNIDNSNTSNGITIGTATASVPITIGHGTGSTVTIGNDLTVTGDLTVSGDTTTVTTSTVAITDSMLLLAKDQANDTDAVDFGFYGKYGDGGTHKYAGIFRDLSVSGDPWTFFDTLTDEPGATVNTAHGTYDLADISIGALTAADASTFSGGITDAGTIAAGTWEGTDVAVAHGGTGASSATAGFDALSPMTAEGDVLYGGSSGTVTKLAKGSDDEVLTLASGVPSWAAASGGSMTSFQLEDADGTEVTINNANEIKFIGSGITTNWTDTDNGTDGDPYDMTFTVDAAQTGVTSIYNAALTVGYGASHANIDFNTDNAIILDIDGTQQVKLVDGVLQPITDSDIDLGTTGVRWKDAFVDSITVTGEVDGASLDISGNADIDGTLETDNLTVGGAQGSDGEVLTSTGSGVAWEAAGGGVDAVFTRFTSSGTWTKADDITTVIVECIGGGGGGGGGEGLSSGLRDAGTGAGGGSRTRMIYDAAQLGSTESITIGAGGAGGTGGSSTDGNPGGVGGNSTLGSTQTAYGGGGGEGGEVNRRMGGTGAGTASVGLTEQGNPGPGGKPTIAMVSGAHAVGGAGGGSASGGNGGNAEWGGGGGGGVPGSAGGNGGVGGGSMWAGAGGGGGGGVDNSNVERSGGAGGASNIYNFGTGAAGGGGGTVGSAGAAGTDEYGGEGGGGGGGQNSGTGATGGAGGAVGGGGGGGGAGTSTGGTGGAGGRGEVRIWEF